MSPPPPHMLSRIIGHGARSMGTRMIIGSQLLLKAKLTTAERMRIFQIVSIHAYERAGPAVEAGAR